MKKNISLFYAIITACIFAMHPPDDPTQAQLFYDELNNRVQNAAVIEEDVAKLKALEIHFFKLSRIYPNKDERWNQSFEAVRNHMLNTPNHAKFFAEEVRSKQAEVAHIPIKPVGERITYDQLRYRYLVNTLSQLPSPETIQVLGEFLHDDKDWPEGPVLGTYSANNGHALYSLKRIGLSNPPENHPYNDSPSCLKQWQEWFEELKAGKRTFSFVGQNVEYRFNADGTWETIALKNPPDDAITFPRYSSSEPPGTAVLLPTNINAADKDTPWWKWLMATLLVISAAISWQIAAKRRDQSSS
jgi:hypothetical protein